MKTEPFDLDKALKGHPLITNAGEKAVNFSPRIPGRCTLPGYAFAAVVNGVYRTYTDKGVYHRPNPNGPNDLLLDVSEVHPFKVGDVVRPTKGSTPAEYLGKQPLVQVVSTDRETFRGRVNGVERLFRYTGCAHLNDGDWELSTPKPAPMPAPPTHAPAPPTHAVFDPVQALNGHPLILSSGDEVINFKRRRWTHPDDDFPYKGEFTKADDTVVKLLFTRHGVSNTNGAHLRMDMTRPWVAPFDLDKALAGHPLVTRDGRPVSNFRERKTAPAGTTYPFLADVPCKGHEQDKAEEAYTAKGEYCVDGGFDGRTSRGRDLLLDIRTLYRKKVCKR